MTLLEFTGCSLIAFGPSLAMFALTIAKDPIRIIILISAAFFWLLSLLISSTFWFLIPLKNLIILGVLFSVIFQELFRYLFYLVLRKAETGLQKVSEVGVRGPVPSMSRVTLSYVSGLGFGIMSGAFSLVNVLADMLGPGTVGLYGDSPHFFITSAFTTHAFVLLHTFWGIIFFNSLDFKKYILVFYVVLTHIVVSSLTLLNQKQLYLASLFPCFIITMITGYIAFLSVGGSILKIKAHLFKSN